jgi:hypothetical protein
MHWGSFEWSNKGIEGGLTQFSSGSVLNIQIGDVTRFTWLGLGELARVTPAGLQKAYHRPSLLSDTVPEWFIATKGLVSGFFKGKKDQSREGKQHQNMLGKRKAKWKVHSRALITTFWLLDDSYI